MAIVLKINLGDDTRRISFDKPPSYEELTQIVKQLFRISVVQLKYEDEDKDKITVTSQIELNEGYQLAARHFNNVLRVFVSETPVASLEANFLMKLISSINSGISANTAEIVGAPAIQEVLTRLGISSPSTSRAAPLPSPSSPLSKINETTTSTAIAPIVEQPVPVVHRGVTCDGCRTENITGIRYKCTVCRNYDLCETCKAKGDEVHPVAHVMLTVSNPVNYHARRGHCWRHASAIRTSPDTTNNKLIATLINSNMNYHRVEPGTKITKVWRVRNDGQTVWPVGTVLVHVGGSEVPAGSKSVLVPLAAPGEEVDVSVDIIMPQEATFISFWRLSTAEGERFGKRMRACFFAGRNLDNNSVEDAEMKARVEAQKKANEEAEKQAKEDAEKQAKEEAEKQAKEEAEKKAREIREAEEVSKIKAEVEEVAAIAQLTDLGFSGDLLAVLRKNGGDVNAAALELMG